MDARRCMFLGIFIVQAFELQVASHGSWTTAYATSGNNQQRTRYVSPAIAGSALRVRMTKAWGLFRVMLHAEAKTLSLAVPAAPHSWE